MAEEQSGPAREQQLIERAKAKGRLATLGVYIKLSGPGWLQSALTLGGGSLSSSLYLGVLAGFSLLWLQPIAMIIGIVMLSAIGYVALSTGEKPFRAINEHVSPVLGWGWLIATLMANCIWSLPQFALAARAFRQNLMPGTFGPEAMGENTANFIIVAVIAVICIIMVYFYDSRGLGFRLFSILLKLMVGVIVVSFFGVVVYLSVLGELPWGDIGSGFIPNIRLLWSPAASFNEALAKVAAIGPQFRDFWAGKIVAQQQDVLVAAAATAVGINMTFLLPYSMLKRGWNKHFRGLAVFDLSTGLFIPFILATGCVVIASASQFHTVPAPGLLGEKDANGQLVKPDPNAKKDFRKNTLARIRFEINDDKALTAEQKKAQIAELTTLTDAEKDKRIEQLPLADQEMAAMLIRRDNIHLAKALSPLTGHILAHYVFGIGVVGMAVSSIIILMLINGFCLTEIIGVEGKGLWYRIGCLVPAVGALGPFIWRGAAPYLAMPTSVFGFIVIPIAYTTFMLVLNSKSLLGDNRPKGAKRWIWNLLMVVGLIPVMIGSVYMAWKKTKASFLGSGWFGVGAIMAFVAAAVIVHFVRRARRAKAA